MNREDVAPIAARLPLVRLDGLRVLVVDDEADARRVLVMVLEQVGAIVTAAGSAREAIEALPKARPDVLVSDLGMPDQDGFDLIRQVRDDGYDARDLPAVALNRVRPEGRRTLGAVGWVSSPRAQARRPARPDIRHCQARGAQSLA